VGIVAVAACGDAKRPTPGALPLAMQSPGPTTLLRLPSHGGTVQAYRSGDLSKLDWQVAKVPAIRRVVGADLDQALVYVVDSARSLLAIKAEQSSERYDLPVNASGAALIAYERGQNPVFKASALWVLHEALKRRSYWRAAIDALRMASDPLV